MNATKRKFNALLNGIGTKSTTSLSSKEAHNDSHVDLTATGDTDSQAKKRRISGSSSIVDGQMARPTLATKLSSAAIKHTKSASLVTATSNAETPKYAPWDRTEFLKRLKSFSNLTDWTPKPARVNEVEWAKRGWVCQKFERVRCCLCNVEILVKLNKKEVDGKEEPVYVAQNIDSIFKLPLNHAPTTLHNLRQRHDDELDLDTVLSYLPKDFFSSSNEPGPSQEVHKNRVAFSMALFGWEGYAHDRLGDQLGSVSCHACFRVLGLWLFKSKGVNDAGEETIGPVVDGLDVVKEHRDYCPWRNPASQNGLQTPSKSGTPTMAGWETTLRVLKNDYFLRHGKGNKESRAEKPTTPDAGSVFDESIADEEEMKSRDEKDKARWARLRRVKSLFETKGGKKLHRTDTKGKPTT
ncbi:uncharacterized protein BP5553_04603 [Venustampulla echinocandica]|uniref:Zf-C3HC-domain-containing protein n=1 Tax=Venustampulla echinocandica TaxID=2656787 RepID=A0A370TNS2_9HELO|nr:uncharacterized protein BP5553_04603 [Venustampulla echinocandica]RDL37170.1 hypothetical protein BP5553_04603 [Venustampulla echinocandica]